MLQWHRYCEHYAAEIFPRLARENPWNYKDDITLLGCAKLYRATGKQVYRNAVLDAGQVLWDGKAAARAWDTAEHNLDTVSFGKSLLTLYELTGDEKHLDGAKKIREHLRTHPRVKAGNYWHKDIYPNQVWLDGLYMALPFQARCDVMAGEKDHSDVLSQFHQVRRHLYVPEKKLYIHAWDESGAADWADPVTGRSPCFWLRAEGWYLMALVDCYEVLQDVTPAASELVELLQEAVEGLIPYQTAETDMFLQLIDRAELPDNYSETSGSAMVAYALMKGERLGMLAETADRGAQILEGIRRTHLQGEGTLLGICASAGLGPGPQHRTDRDGSPEYYLSERQIPDNQHGAAACMMAVAERLLLGGAR